MEQLAAAPRIRRRDSLSRASGWLRQRLTTTPDRLVVVSVLIGVGAVCFGTAVGITERSRQQAAQAVRTQTEPLLVQAVSLYASLSDANATAATTFLTGGLEPVSRRARYLADLRAATGSLAALTREAGGSADARAAIATISNQLPIYAGLVEAARANNRQGFPVGAAYLRAASNLLTTSILPAADQLYAIEARRLTDDYASGTSTTTLVVFAVAVAVSLALLLLAQIYLARISRRIFNVPMLAATVILAVLSIWGLIGLVGEQNALARAQRNGSDSVEVLSATRILASRAQSDESLTLVNRGSDQQDPADFALVVKALGGLVGQTAELDRRTGTSSAANTMAGAFSAYRAEHTQIAGLERSGQIEDAINAAVRAGTPGHSAADLLSANLGAQISAAQLRFSHAAGDATSSLSGLSPAIPIMTVLAAALALFGLRQRIGEYR
jgi:hypothetical protein